MNFFLVQQLKLKLEALYMEISKVLEGMAERSNSIASESCDTTDAKNRLVEFKDQLIKERTDYMVNNTASQDIISNILKCNCYH